MNFKSIIVAAAMTVLPAMASALTIMEDGDSFQLGNGFETEFLGNVEGDGGGGSFTVNFFTLEDPLSAHAEATIGPIASGAFTDLTLSWVSTFDNEVLATTPIVPVTTILLTTFMSPEDLSQNLVISWSDSLDGAGFDVEVEAKVPLPAGILLMGTALAGIGVMRRRKKAA